MPTFWKPAHLPLTDVFIETGTQYGHSVAAALGAGYPSCLSVDFVEMWYEYAKKRFAGDARVKLFHGSSPEMLPVMIDPQKSTIFWLDAHYSGSDKAWQDPRYGECPLLEELRLIVAMSWREPPIICIDDAFIFRESTWAGSGAVFDPALFTRSHWPMLADIQKILAGYDIREESYVLFCQKRKETDPTQQAASQPEIAAV